MDVAVALVIHGCHPRTPPPRMCELPQSCTHTCSAQKQRSGLKTPPLSPASPATATSLSYGTKFSCLPCEKDCWKFLHPLQVIWIFLFFHFSQDKGHIDSWKCATCREKEGKFWPVVFFCKFYLVNLSHRDEPLEKVNVPE